MKSKIVVVTLLSALSITSVTFAANEDGGGKEVDREPAMGGAREVVKEGVKAMEDHMKELDQVDKAVHSSPEPKASPKPDKK